MITNNHDQHELEFLALPGGNVVGTCRVPGDKSISHRSIMLGAIAEGITIVNGFLEGEDALSTLQAFRDMGVEINRPISGEVHIHGVGLHGLQAPEKPLYLGNSGTSMRLLAGLLAGQKFSVMLTGDSSLTQRPMRRVTEPLKLMGANITSTDHGTSPLKITPAKLQGINYSIPVASAQVKSCLLLAGLYAEGMTTVIEPAPCRDHTERMLRGFGYEVNVTGPCASLHGGSGLKACVLDVPGDISSAAFFLVAASISQGSDLLLQHVGINPTRLGVINILKAMGADITYERTYDAGGEPVADIRVRYAALQGIQIPESEVPLAIDEFPVLFIAAACAEGETVLTGANELRVKESDRIQAMADGLAVLGVVHEVHQDGIVIKGQGGSKSFRGGKINSHGDHRIAMAFTIASLRAEDPIQIKNCSNVATSFPNFVELAQLSGILVTEIQRA
jgi:3-phosphoshikimate 1-carboxyvinyltransferase